MAETFTLDQLWNAYQSRTKLFITENDLLRQVQFHTDVVDQIDGKIILQSNLSLGTEKGEVSFPMNLWPDQMHIEATQGKAIIQTDPYNGKILITPRGDVPVKVRPIFTTTLGGSPVRLVGTELEVGIGVSGVALAERTFANAAGGGACSSNGNFGGMAYQFQLRVRAFMPSNVIPLSNDRRLIKWNHALYFAHDPKIGFMRIGYNPAFQSQTNLQSLSTEKEGGESAFFPARGQNELNFIIEMLDLGLSCFNKHPMVQTYDYTHWPPYSTVLTIDEPVEFYNTENPDQLMMVIEKNDMQLYDYSSINVEVLHYEISEEGEFHSRWKFTNQSKEQAMARWFALGNYKKNGGTPDQGNRLLGPAGSGYDVFEVNFSAPLEKSSLSQFITMNIVSLNDPVLMGSKRIDFIFPESKG